MIHGVQNILHIEGYTMACEWHLSEYLNMTMENLGEKLRMLHHFGIVGMMYAFLQYIYSMIPAEYFGNIRPMNQLLSFDTL